MFDVEGFILVGGRSSRMGEDKSQLGLGDETTVERLQNQLRLVASRIRLVGLHQQSNTDLENVADRHKEWGALGGIHAALGACEAEWATIVACDLPFVTSALLLRLVEIAKADGDASLDAVVPIQPDRRPQPLCALYRRSSCFKVTEKIIAAGEHTPRALLELVRTRWVDFEELANLSGAEHFFFNVNTPADYERAKQIVKNQAGVAANLR